MKTVHFKVGITGVIFSVLTPSAYADYSVEQELQKFHQNPSVYMKSQEPLRKFVQTFEYSNDETVQNRQQEHDAILVEEREQQVGAWSRFAPDQLEKNKFIEQKLQRHEGTGEFGIQAEQTYKQNARQQKASYGDDDLASNLVDGKIQVWTMKDIVNKGLTSKNLGRASPWSDDYWALYKGSGAKRYHGSQISESKDWREIANFVLKDNFWKWSKEQLKEKAHTLSPSEKYDLLVGDENRTLTKAMLGDGNAYVGATMSDFGVEGGKGSVERWMGNCHGWAAAAYMEDRPHKMIEVLAADKKTKIPFYPTDIKALATVLWAKAAPQTKFIGNRCNQKDPETDDNGRVLDQSCFDTNPGTFLLSVVNQIGVFKRSFVLDATFDYEVWNQPAWGYSITFFNPNTNKEVSSWTDAQVTLPFKNDKFAKWRDKQRGATSVVGVAMTFTYIAETTPSPEKKDSPDSDRKVAVKYLMDVELDANGKIVGGEWYHQQHPDFLWTPYQDKERTALTDADRDLKNNHDKWHKSKSHSIPESWQQAAKEASANQGAPLQKIVRALIEKSNKNTFMGFRF